MSPSNTQRKSACKSKGGQFVSNMSATYTLYNMIKNNENKHPMSCIVAMSNRIAQNVKCHYKQLISPWSLYAYNQKSKYV